MINLEGFLATLPVMAYGMAGIFVVIGIIVLATKLLCKAFPPKSE